MQTLTLKGNDLGLLQQFLTEVGSDPRRLNKVYPELKWRALGKLDEVVADVEVAVKPWMDFALAFDQEKAEREKPLRQRLETANEEEKPALIKELNAVFSTLAEEKELEAERSKEIVLELGDEKYEMAKKLLDEYGMEIFIRRGPLDILLPAFGLKD